MGGEGHQLEEGGVNPNDPAAEDSAPLDSGADGGPMDDDSMGRTQPDDASPTG